ncbi:hypothetical protein KA977_02390, partial [Candidatus Dependentiae bacterium]|nr:hypothetical protein [Candidatus Dependentiae bacterium]
SPTVTGIWENTLGRAHIIQPGSYDRHLAYVIIEILETGVISSRRYMQRLIDDDLDKSSIADSIYF